MRLPVPRRRDSRAPRGPDDRDGKQALTRHPVLLGLAIALVAANLRPALASVGPVLDDVRIDLALTGTLAALLVSLPVLCLGALAPAAPRLARRWGMEPIIAMVLGAIAAGLLLRVVGGTGCSFGTVIASGAIAVANVLLPALIKRDFPKHSGAMMGVYTMAISGFAAVAAASTVPLGDLIGYGWRGALGVWAILAVVALLLWMPFANAHTPPAATTPTGSSLLRHALTWELTVFRAAVIVVLFGAFVASIDLSRSWVQPGGAGLVLSAVTFVQIPVSLLVPRFAARARDQRRYIMISTTLTALGLAGVLIAPTTMPYLWAMIIGVGLGSSFAIGLLHSFFAAGPHQTRRSCRPWRRHSATSGGNWTIAAWCRARCDGSWSPPLALLLVLVSSHSSWSASSPAGRSNSRSEALK